MNSSKKTIDVVAAVIIRNNNEVFVTRRKPGKALAGKWEFPGGKVEKEESHQDALIRELNEEFGIVCEVLEFISSNTHNYDSISINLHAYLSRIIKGTIIPKDHDLVEWVPVEQVLGLDLAPADIPIVSKIEDLIRVRANQEKM